MTLHRRHASRTAFALALALAALALASCSSAPPSRPAGAPLHVVAAENVWGSLAEQLGGEKAQVESVISNPNTDPHDYEPTVADARAIASADMVVASGMGYDPWLGKLLAANPDARRIELDAGAVVGAPSGANPHLWYSPADVRRVIAAITDGYKRLDPADAAYFDARRRSLETTGLARYDQLVSAIASEYAGTPVGASESVVVPLAEALRLPLVTPPGFLSAVSQGVDPSVADKATVDEQIAGHRIAVLLYNRQNSTPDVMALVAEAKAAGIPVVTVTETLQPAGTTFQDWQVAQLTALQAALKHRKGRWN